eukprot:1153343-Pelagomonas_calceolata.AAC.5
MHFCRAEKHQARNKDESGSCCVSRIKQHQSEGGCLPLGCISAGQRSIRHATWICGPCTLQTFCSVTAEQPGSCGMPLSVPALQSSMALMAVVRMGSEKLGKNVWANGSYLPRTGQHPIGAPLDWSSSEQA